MTGMDIIEEQNEALRAEVEKLAEQRNVASTNAGNLSILLSEAKAEVERLTNELSGYESAYEQRRDDYDRVREALFDERNKSELRGVMYNAALARAEKAEAEVKLVTVEHNMARALLEVVEARGFRADATIAVADEACKAMMRERDEMRRERNQAVADKERILSLENMR